MHSDDYKLICEDDITKRLKNCHTLTPVDCNPEVLDALKSGKKKMDHRLQDVSKDILWAATIVTKSLLALDKVAQDEDLPQVAREVGVLNEALALLGNANYKNNLARRFTMKSKINHKYAHQQGASYSFPVRDQNKRLLGFAFAQEFQPYGQLRHRARGAQQHYTTRQDSIPKKRQEPEPAQAPAAVEARELEYIFNDTETRITSEETDWLLKLKIIHVMQRMECQVILPIF
ncbi:hypothetical protein E2C01_076460 [Portunus trituberculatus]|uniref:Uncharacterized protein n=1 Tax=Portunus trituberculatus TaxID=210409 RepID=A0A5B7IHU7_PORTR|nr:hypothetical protein [Portunus trituberculatus]